MTISSVVDYSVRYHLMKVDGKWNTTASGGTTTYNPKETASGTAAPGSELKADTIVTGDKKLVREYDGFTLFDKDIETGKIHGTKLPFKVNPDPKDNVLNFYYSRNTYKLTYDLQGGKTADGKEALNENTYFYEAKLSTGYTDSKLPVPKKEGYEFVGWFDKETEGTEYKADSTMPAADLKLYARWAAGGVVGSTTTEVGAAVSGNPVKSVKDSNINEVAVKNEKTFAVDGKNVLLNLKVAVKTQGDVSQGDTIASQTFKKSLFGFETQDGINFAFLDISVLKYVKEKTADKHTETPTRDTITPLEIVLEIDTNAAKNLKNMVMTRVHDGKVEPMTNLATRPTSDFVDGTFFVDVDKGLLYIYSRYFSTYTIASVENASLVTFETNGGEPMAQRLIKNGVTLNGLEEPTKEGYTFEGWYRESALTNMWNETDQITGNVTLYAKWTEGAEGQFANRTARSESGTEESEESTVRGSRTGDNKEVERIARLLAIMATTWIVLFNALAFGKKRKVRNRRK
ncbi:MAG: InlB B-repeat-containing protein [Lachnospiraceae bacterium]|nr:InlB B-repeat-containing protein [Lachnospiraceae bacterium]